MPIDASTDPYDSSGGFDPAGAKFDRPDLPKAFGDDADPGDSRGVATSKVDRDEIDEDLGRAGTGASRAAAIDLSDVRKEVPGDLGAKVEPGSHDDVDLDRAGTGAGTGLKAAIDDVLDEQRSGDVDKFHGADHHLDDSLKSALHDHLDHDVDKFDRFDKFDHDHDHEHDHDPHAAGHGDHADKFDHGHDDHGDKGFHGLH